MTTATPVSVSVPASGPVSVPITHSKPDNLAVPPSSLTVPPSSLTVPPASDLTPAVLDLSHNSGQAGRAPAQSSSQPLPPALTQAPAQPSAQPLLLMARAWCMPGVSTFRMPPVQELLSRWMPEKPGTSRWIDPFAGDSPTNAHCVATNDLDPGAPTTHHMEAMDFLRVQYDAGGVVDGLLFDAPRNSTQVAECLKRAKITPSQQDTQSGWYTKRKAAAAFVVRMGGLAICAGWNSGGLGKNNGFELLEVLLVAHGGSFPDTIITVERKVRDTLA